MDLSFAERSPVATKLRHSLSEKNTELRTARCAICGPVKIRKNGKSWTCATKRSEVNRNYRKRHPEQTDIRPPSAHRLTDADHRTMTGTCPTCGPVAIVPWGRGYLCANRARELRTVQQDEPQARCWKCRTWDSYENPVADEVCSRCTEELQAGRTLLAMPGTAHTAESLREATFLFEMEEKGMHVVYPDDPYELDDQEAVPGWQVVGSPLPTRLG